MEWPQLHYICLLSGAFTAGRKSLCLLMIMQLIKEPIILARLNLNGSCDILLCVVHADAGLCLCSSSTKHILFCFSVTDHHNANHVFLLILIFKVLHSHARGGETNKSTNKPSLCCLSVSYFKTEFYFPSSECIGEA